MCVVYRNSICKLVAKEVVLTSDKHKYMGNEVYIKIYVLLF